MRLRAAILWDGTVLTSPGHYACRYAQNTLEALGIHAQFVKALSAHPTAAMLAGDYDLIVIPLLRSGNQAVFGKFLTGAVTVPVFCCGVDTGTIASVPGAATAETATFNDARFALAPDRLLYTNGRRYTLSVSAPVEVQVLVEGAADTTMKSAWRYTADASSGRYLYLCTLWERYNLLPYLIQRAITDGVLDGSRIQKIPVILSIDHINGGGLFQTGDGTELGGFQAQPDNIAHLGDLLRSMGGICYTDLEERWISANGTAPNTGTTTGELLANLREYSDVFRYLATHNHLLDNEWTNPWAGGIAKATLDASYQSTKAAIESLGLTVTTDLATFRGNNYGRNDIELITREVTKAASVDGATIKVGYGYRAVRSTDGNYAQCWPRIPNPLVSGVPPWHWRFRPHRHRGVTIIPGRDFGFANNNVDAAVKIKFQSWSSVTEAYSCGTIGYFHHDDFEDVSKQPSGVSTGGMNDTYGVTTWQRYADMQAMCPDTLDIGCDLTRYIP